MFFLKQEAYISKETEVSFTKINQTMTLKEFNGYGLYRSNGTPMGLYFIDAFNVDTDTYVTWTHTDKQNMFPTSLINKFDFVFEHEFKNSKVYGSVVIDSKNNPKNTIIDTAEKLAPKGVITEPIITVNYISEGTFIKLAMRTMVCAGKTSLVVCAQNAFIIEFDAHFYKCSISPLFKDTTIKIYSFDSGQTIHVPLKYPWCKLEEKLISIW